MRLRPHHILDIIAHHGAGLPFEPSPYGHAVHTVAETLLAHREVAIEFVADADDICTPCRHLIDGRCDDLLTHRSPPLPKLEYNDDLDRRLLAFLGLTEGDVLTFGQYLAVVRAHLDGIETVCTHPGEDPARRLANLTAGLRRLETPAQ